LQESQRTHDKHPRIKSDHKFILVFVETGSCFVVQARLELLGLGDDPPTLCLLSADTTGTPQCLAFFFFFLVLSLHFSAHKIEYGHLVCTCLMG
jgi:hypothetical protein